MIDTPADAQWLTSFLRPLGWGIGVAVGLIAVETVVAVYLSHVAPVALVVFLPVALLANLVMGRARRATEADDRRETDAQAGRRASFHDVATLMARGAEPADVALRVVAELAGGLDVEHVTLVLVAATDECTVQAVHDSPGRTTLGVGERLSIDGDAGVAGAVATRMRELGLRSVAGAPVVVGDRTRGALIAGSSHAQPTPPGTEERLAEFADLMAITIANAETLAELTASRARIVATGDHARRRFERAVGDGIQQRVVALGNGLRTVEASVPVEDHIVRKQLENVINGLADLYTKLQELSREIHPATLSKGGLGPALRGLARRSTIPVGVAVDVVERFPDAVELAAYHVVAEALVNAAAHARATEVTVRVGVAAGQLLLEVADDGVGGASTSSGSGLVGLRDRVEAASGQLDVSSPPGVGTTLTARLPGVPRTSADPAGGTPA